MTLIKQLRQSARQSAEASQLLARAKSERNQAAGDAGANYDGGTPEQMLEWKAADEIERLEKMVRYASDKGVTFPPDTLPTVRAAVIVVDPADGSERLVYDPDAEASLKHYG